MKEETSSKIKKVLKTVDNVGRIFLLIFFSFGIYLIMKSAIIIAESQPTQAVLILSIVVNSLISLMIYCRMD